MSQGTGDQAGPRRGQGTASGSPEQVWDRGCGPRGSLSLQALPLLLSLKETSGLAAP